MDERELSTLDVGAIVEYDGDLLVLVDYARPAEYGDGVWATVDESTGDFSGLVTDGAGQESDPVMVELVDWEDRYGDD